mmetsp:Transcript_17733/g.44336  ORF Transcript_17733/g.44336 Transcript_17733/m.44336 type:complete len:560 (+) Transcript_17733:44-1723(+)|eukprot:CAMPEP_0178988020 /NCGR_PEP_ID=MMETSP0795-20121207/3586_1 /TAXON_ID=88552 /ORGANISM="Amoebophrya sp., Strain Ameob2" /LENGTH=559 /DNA_ID=CAMNT_0020679263 /DNA_START=364 /DNA_END=2043 /DNA_ORIENTATION=-
MEHEQHNHAFDVTLTIKSSPDAPAADVGDGAQRQHPPAADVATTTSTKLQEKAILPAPAIFSRKLRSANDLFAAVTLSSTPSETFRLSSGRSSELQHAGASAEIIGSAARQFALQNRASIAVAATKEDQARILGGRGSVVKLKSGATSSRTRERDQNNVLRKANDLDGLALGLNVYVVEKTQPLAPHLKRRRTKQDHDKNYQKVDGSGAAEATGAVPDVVSARTGAGVFGERYVVAEEFTTSTSSANSSTRKSSFRTRATSRLLEAWKDYAIEPVRKHGRGHPQMLMRSLLAFGHGMCSVGLFLHEVDQPHFLPRFCLQFGNAWSLFYAWRANDVNQFLVRSVFNLLLAAVNFHAFACGRRWIHAPGFSDDTKQEKLLDMQSRGYPASLDDDSVVCFTPALIESASVSFLLFFRVLHFLQATVGLLLAVNLFLHWRSPGYGVRLTALKGTSEEDAGESDESESGSKRRSKQADDKDEVEDEEPTTLVLTRGTVWLRGRALLVGVAVVLDVCKLVGKVTVIPGDSYFHRDASEPIIHAIRGAVLRPLQIASLMTQFYYPT